MIRASTRSWQTVLPTAIVLTLGAWFNPGGGPTLRAQENPPVENASGDDLPPTSDADSDELTDLPKFESLTKPGFEELMSGPAVDWILVNQERVLRVEPVVPRPRTVEQINEQVKKLIPRSGQTETEAAKKKRLALFQLPVTLLEGE
ncbi:MAG: hypothetical protein NT069_33470, partial [Planctomycetota bacterium]|nr:hypothetical protein [Planctomycetota bacterium]